MKAIVIYEELEFTTRADAILHRVGGRAEINIEWTVSCWPVDALIEKKSAGKLLVQAQNAHLIVLPANLARFIPLRLLGWLERWAKLRHNPEVTLGILHEREFSHIEMPVHPALLKFAHENGLALVRNGSPCPNECGKRAFFFELERRSALPVEFYRHGNYDRPEAYRGFGINE
jgi:hypothetical protein